MPNLALSISNLESSVERPIVYDIIRQVMQITQISSQTPISFYGDEGKAAQQNSTMAKSLVVENRWQYDERVSIEVDEDFERERILSIAVKGVENNPVFEDLALGIVIKPIYSPTQVRIKVNYRTRDKNQASRWRNDIRVATALMRDVNLHQLSYHYNLPVGAIVLLQEMYRLRERVGGYGQTWHEYFTDHLTSTASVVTNLSGQEGVWAVSEKQIRVQGLFEFEGVPDKPESSSDHDEWITSFSYRFIYDKPIQCNLVYPLVIHNQLLSGRYRPTVPAYSLHDQLRSFSHSGKMYAAFESDTELLQYRGSLGISIPSFDEFVPNSAPAASVRVLCAMATITPAERRSLFNLGDLGTLNLDGDVLEFIAKSEHPFMGTTYASVLCLNLYIDQNLQASKSLVIARDLQIRSVAALPLRRTSRVRLGLIVDMDFLTPGALERLRQYPKAAAKIARAIDAVLRDKGGQLNLGKNRLTPRDYALMGLDPNGSYEPWLGRGAGAGGGGAGGASAWLGGSTRAAAWYPGANKGGEPTRRDNLTVSKTADPKGTPWGLVQMLFVTAQEMASSSGRAPASYY
jgi:hypothetical protein